MGFGAPFVARVGGATSNQRASTHPTDYLMAPSLSVRIERWPIAGSFTISRGTKTEAAVVVAEIVEGDHRGRGECVPYARYGETLEGVADAIMAMSSNISRGLDRLKLQEAIG